MGVGTSTYGFGGDTVQRITVFTPKEVAEQREVLEHLGDSGSDRHRDGRIQGGQDTPTSDRAGQGMLPAGVRQRLLGEVGREKERAEETERRTSPVGEQQVQRAGIRGI